MAWIDGYEPVTPADQSPGSAPGTEKTNENQASPGPTWAKSTLKGQTPGKPGGSDNE